MKFASEGKFNEDYMSKENTTAINVIFVILVVFSHFSQYHPEVFCGIYDDTYINVKEYLNQMVVATFLFYSGYGMMESIKKRGVIYLRKIPVKFLKLLFNFDLAMYILIWIVFSPIRLKNSAGVRLISSIMLLLCAMAFMYILLKAGRPKYCWNIAILLPLGFLYSNYKNIIEKIVMHNDYIYLMIVAISIILQIISFKYRFSGGTEGFTIWAMSFIVIIILFTMKISVKNNFLIWFGKNIFPVYILQRIPMNTLNKPD